MVRTPSCDKSGLRKGTWTPEEDRKLFAYVTRYGTWNWRQLPKFAGLARCGKSCRLRWINYLRPNVKRGNFTQEEEECIIRMHKKLGNKWSAIAAELHGRTDNEIKNHWHTTLKKRSKQNVVTITNEEARAFKSKDKVLNNKGVTVTLPATTQVSDNSSLSPVSSSCSEFSSITSDISTAATSMKNLVFEDDEFGFLDPYIDIDNTMNESFWLDDISFNNASCEKKSGNSNGSFESTDYSKIHDSCAFLSPHGSSNESIVVDNEFVDAYAESTVDSFWTQPYVAGISHVPSELLVPSVPESEYFTPIYDDLWG